MRQNRAYSELTHIETRATISNDRSQSSKPESTSHQQQNVASASNPLQKIGPEYEEVVELKKNKAYELRPNIEMRANISMLQSQGSEPESSSQQQQQASAEYEKPIPARSRDERIDLRENVAYGPSNADLLL